jgi:hypothetical protein
MVVLACMAVQWVALIPVGIAAAIIVLQGPAWTLIVGPTVVLYGYGLWAAGVGYASRWAFWRQPELLLAVDPRRRDSRS